MSKAEVENNSSIQCRQALTPPVPKNRHQYLKDNLTPSELKIVRDVFKENEINWKSFLKEDLVVDDNYEMIFETVFDDLDEMPNFNFAQMLVHALSDNNRYSSTIETHRNDILAEFIVLCGAKAKAALPADPIDQAMLLNNFLNHQRQKLTATFIQNFDDFKDPLLKDLLEKYRKAEDLFASGHTANTIIPAEATKRIFKEITEHQLEWLAKAIPEGIFSGQDNFDLIKETCEEFYSTDTYNDLDYSVDNYNDQILDLYTSGNSSQHWFEETQALLRGVVFINEIIRQADRMKTDHDLALVRSNNEAWGSSKECLFDLCKSFNNQIQTVQKNNSRLGVNDFPKDVSTASFEYDLTPLNDLLERSRKHEQAIERVRNKAFRSARAGKPYIIETVPQSS